MQRAQAGAEADEEEGAAASRSLVPRPLEQLDAAAARARLPACHAKAQRQAAREAREGAVARGVLHREHKALRHAQPRPPRAVERRGGVAGRTSQRA